MRLLIAVLTASAFVAEAASAAAYVFPRNGLSPQDEAYALFTETCSEESADERRPPEVRRTEDGFIVDFYRMRPEEEHFCYSPAPPPSLYPVLLGKLPRGTYTIEMRDHVRDYEGTVYTLIGTTTEKLVVKHTPNPAVSGLWFDPAVAGAGLSVTLLPTGGRPGEPKAALVLNTIDQYGRAIWYTGQGTFQDGVLTTEMTRGGDLPTSGEAVFRYLGCGEAEFEMPGHSLRFPRGTARVQQLSRTFDAGNCEPSQYSLRGED